MWISYYIHYNRWNYLSILKPNGCSSLQWRHNERDVVSNHQPHVCLLNRLFRRRSKKASKLRVTGLCAGNSPVASEFPAQRVSNAENASILMPKSCWEWIDKRFHIHDNVTKWRHFPRYWPFAWGSPVNSHHKGHWRGALMFSLSYAWTMGWVHNRDAGDLRRHAHRAHYDVTVMSGFTGI